MTGTAGVVEPSEKQDPPHGNSTGPNSARSHPKRAKKASINRRPAAVAIAALFGVTVLTYGFYIPQLGFYWDDWPTAWIIHSNTYTINDFFASDRPFVGLMYTAIIKVLPADPLVWQILAMLLRWWCAIAVWWIVRSVWRRREQVAFMAACLFLVYPGFTHQAIALTYSSLTFMLLTLLISFGASIQALRQPKRRVLFITIGICGLAVSFAAEYYLMLEMLRVGLLYVVVSEQTKGRRERRRRTFLAWLPYLIFTGIYFFWRFVVFHPTRPGVGLLALTEFKISPIDSIVVTTKRMVTTVANTGGLAWAQPFNPRIVDLAKGPATGIALVLGVLAAAVAWKAWSLLRADDGHETTKSISAAPDSSRSPDALVTRQLLVLSALGIFGAGIPAWLTARQVELGNTWDRYTLGGMLGAALLVIGTIRALKLNPRATVSVFAVMVGFSSAFLVQNARTYADDSAAQRDLFAQLQWRLPRIKAGSSILLDPGKLIDARGYSMTATAADTMGYRLGPNGEVPFWIFVPADFDKTELGPYGFPTGGLAERKFTTKDDPKQFAVLVKPDRGCLRVLDPGRPELWPSSSPIAEAEAPRSSPGAVSDGPGRGETSIVSVLGEPEHGWCYWFEVLDATLADQNFSAAKSIADDALGRGLLPDAGAEWIPFAEAYLRVGDLGSAERVLDRAVTAPGTRRSLCLFADRVASRTGHSDANQFGDGAAAVTASACRR